MINTSKTAIVTGASRGMGEGLVEAFLKRGYGVVANSRNITKANPFASDANLALVDGDIGHAKHGRCDCGYRGIAIWQAKDSIRVNTIAPGVINTPMHKPETHDFLKGLHPVGRIGEVEEVVDAA